MAIANDKANLSMGVHTICIALTIYYFAYDKPAFAMDTTLIGYLLTCL